MVFNRKYENNYLRYSRDKILNMWHMSHVCREQGSTWYIIDERTTRNGEAFGVRFAEGYRPTRWARIFCSLRYEHIFYAFPNLHIRRAFNVNEYYVRVW